jgi:hypothetical protein
LSKCNINENLVLRCLDDVPVISAASNSHCEEFTSCYKDLCNNVNVKLAEECPRFEKAFANSTFGKVLGIWFDTQKMCWFYPESKARKVLLEILAIVSKPSCNLLEMQELLGCLNNFAQLMPFMNFFKKPLNDLLCACFENPDSATVVNDTVKQDLLVWAACIMDSVEGLPICNYYYAPPLTYKSLASDAAGVPFTGLYKGGVGVGCIGFDEQGVVISAFQFFWSKNFVSWKDNKEAEMGSKTTTLEILGVLCNVVLNLDLLFNQHVVLLTDNIACYYGWINKCVRDDVTASILIRCLGLLSAYLGSRFHIIHLPRLSNWEGQVVDRLSRKSTTTSWDRKLVESFGNQRLPVCLQDWLDHSAEDWNLPLRLLNEITNK